MAVSPKIQTVFFLKIFNYDSSLKGDIKIGILDVSGKNEIEAEFNALSGQKINNSRFSVSEVTYRY